MHFEGHRQFPVAQLRTSNAGADCDTDPRWLRPPDLRGNLCTAPHPAGPHPQSGPVTEREMDARLQAQ